MKPLHLFNAYGVELEYMIVDADSLEVKPISDLILGDEAGSLQGDVRRSDVTWSNELVLHLIELKSSRPVVDLKTLQRSFHANILRINSLLKKYNGVLMPGAMHPFMHPESQMRLWPHDYKEVYNAYDALFNCSGHGWANVQSVHLNLPFFGDEEFHALHQAIRIVLPILPALCSSSPVVDAKLTGFADTRLNYYRSNQVSIPSFAGAIIPDEISTRKQYESDIYERIREDITSNGMQEILDPVWVNARGAIPRFDRGSIEIRLMDVQECPAADVAVIALVTETIKDIVEGNFGSLIEPQFSTELLVNILNATIQHGGDALITDGSYLSFFDAPGEMTASELWKHIFEKVQRESNLQPYSVALKNIMEHGTLSKRIVKRLGRDFSKTDLVAVYKQLCVCLSDNKVFVP
jgi:gamma-glutamyl:cysteine ligase YbdK (ATP-grasp superfamily)